MKGFKVTTRFGKSIFVGEPSQYGLHTTTRPNPGCGPLTVFKTLEDLAAWLLASFKVWECEYTPWTEELPVYEGHRIACWINTNRGFQFLTEAKLPPGTDLASEVTLTADPNIGHGFTVSDAEDGTPVHTVKDKWVFRTDTEAAKYCKPGEKVWNCLYTPQMSIGFDFLRAQTVILQRPVSKLRELTWLD